MLLTKWIWEASSTVYTRMSFGVMMGLWPLLPALKVSNGLSSPKSNLSQKLNINSGTSSGLVITTSRSHAETTDKFKILKVDVFTWLDKNWQAMWEKVRQLLLFGGFCSWLFLWHWSLLCAFFGSRLNALDLRRKDRKRLRIRGKKLSKIRHPITKLET